MPSLMKSEERKAKAHVGGRMMKRKILIAALVLLVLVLAAASILAIPFASITVVTRGEPIERYEDAKKAVLVIDVQKNLTSEDGTWILNLDQTDRMIEKINEITKAAERSGIIVVYITNEFARNSIINRMTDRAMEEKTEGAKMDERVRILSGDHFIKNKMDAFSSRSFEEFLIASKVDHLILTGIDAEDCVDKTFKGALNRKYRLTVVSDAVATKSYEALRKKLEDFRIAGAEVIAASEFIGKYAADPSGFRSSAHNSPRIAGAFSAMNPRVCESDIRDRNAGYTCPCVPLMIPPA